MCLWLHVSEAFYLGLNFLLPDQSSFAISDKTKKYKFEIISVSFQADFEVIFFCKYIFFWIVKTSDMKL